jgi:hypothetical protein
MTPIKAGLFAVDFVNVQVLMVDVRRDDWRVRLVNQCVIEEPLCLEYCVGRVWSVICIYLTVELEI